MSMEEDVGQSDEAAVTGPVADSGTITVSPARPAISSARLRSTAKSCRVSSGSTKYAADPKLDLESRFQSRS